MTFVLAQTEGVKFLLTHTAECLEIRWVFIPDE